MNKKGDAKKGLYLVIILIFVIIIIYILYKIIQEKVVSGVFGGL